ncbi:MAG TPA: Stf0 family sulfotransferase, partial [Solirubrobacteraceae bacterium]|nr:Stf0 family sulfotransferase [Solirubrobacteraceae bacterium]
MTVSYLVCATPRSGSTLLCHTLRKTGVAGHPFEFFEALPETGVPRRPIDYLAGLDDPEALALIGSAPAPEAPPYSDLRGYASYDEHLEKVRATGTTPNGVFGAKIMWAHLEDLGRQLGSDDLNAVVDEVFDKPRFVWVRRQDTVRQAVSLWRAMQTQSWRAENEPATGEPQYSYAALRHLVELLEAHDRAWDRFLGAKDHVLTLTYEEIASDIGDAVKRTLEHLEVAPDAAVGALPTMRRQADQRSDEWA